MPAEAEEAEEAEKSAEAPELDNTSPEPELPEPPEDYSFAGEETPAPSEVAENFFTKIAGNKKQASREDIEAALQEVPAPLKEMLIREFKGEFTNLRPLDPDEIL